MDKIRWGVIGAGGIADRRTLPGMMDCAEAELIAVMEINPELAESLRKKYGAKRAYVSDEALLQDPEIDAVYIASPVVLHARQAMMAADYGKHILIEKPLALTSDEGRRVIEYCDSKKVRIAAGFMMRFGTCIQQMREAYLAGKIGQLVSIYTQFTCWYPDMPGNWRQKKSTGGGGALTDMGVHLIDLIQFVTDSKVARVAAFNDTQTFSYEVEDASSLILKLENGTQCCLQTNFNIPDPAAKWRFEMFGTRGHLLGDTVIGQVDTGEVEAMYVDGVGGYDAQQNNDQRAQSERLSGEYGNLYTREIRSFCRSILTGEPLIADARGAVEVQRVIEAAYQSGEEGRVIDLTR